MRLRNDEQRYGLAARLFHWSVALLVLALLPIGWYMHDLPLGLERFRYVELHKSLGLLVLALMIGRGAWRAFNPPPPLPDDMPVWERHAAALTHWALYALLFAQILCGMGYVWAANSPLTFFGWFALPSPVAPDRSLRNLMGTVHDRLAYVIVALLFMHIGAALRHHFILKNNILRRMLMVAVVVFAGAYGAPVSAANWNVLPSSRLLFHFVQSGLSFTGKFERFEARIEFDPDNPEDSRIDVTIDIASLDTQNSERDTMLRSPELFDVEKFPRAQFTADRIRELEHGRYEAVGTLTIRDIILPLVLPFALQIEQEAGEGDTRAVAAGVVTISRRDFGLARGQWEATDIVSDEVKIEIRLEAIQQR